MKKPGPPPIREIVIQNDRFKEGFALWLSNLSSLVSRADNSVNSTVSVTSPNATDLASVLVLANELKSDLNQLVTDLNDLKTKLRNAGTIES